MARRISSRERRCRLRRRSVWSSVTEVSKSVDYLGTVRGRIGFLFATTLLVYATGGLAYGSVKSSTSQFQGFVPPLPFAITQAWGAAGSYSDTRTGWTVGGGLEWMFLPRLRTYKVPDGLSL